MVNVSNVHLKPLYSAHNRTNVSPAHQPNNTTAVQKVANQSQQKSATPATSTANPNRPASEATTSGSAHPPNPSTTNIHTHAKHALPAKHITPNFIVVNDDIKHIIYTHG